MTATHNRPASPGAPATSTSTGSAGQGAWSSVGRTSLVQAVTDRRISAPRAVTFRRKVDGVWTNVTAREFADAVDSAAAGLLAAGIEAGDRVAIMSSTRYEWTVLDYAIWRVGAITVAVYETSAASQIEWILEDSGARLLFVETPEMSLRAAPVLEKLGLGSAPIIEAGALEDLDSAGRALEGDTRALLDARVADVRVTDPATLIYTSGTTGRPKGVVLTHANLLAEVGGAQAKFGDLMGTGTCTLLFIPMAHVYARVVNIAGVERGMVIGHTSDLVSLMADLAEFKPDFILSVPRIFEKLYNSAQQAAADSGKGAIFARAEKIAIDYSRALDGGGPGLALRVQHAVFDKLIYAKLRALFGGRVRGSISGGAPLGERLGHFFRGAGLTVLEGWGMTETTAGATSNALGAHRVGTCGQALEGCEIKIAEDGELLFRGPILFREYWNNPKATAESTQDGWFATGDIGTIDADGYLSITGRKKEIIVTSGGKNVSPVSLEDPLRAHPLISEALVVGDGQKYIAALITLDAEALGGWAERHKLPKTSTAADLLDNPQLRAEIDDAVAAANLQVSHAEAIKRYSIEPDEFTIENGELTTTLKLRRAIIADRRSAAIAALYQ